MSDGAIRIVERNAVRLVVLDAQQHILLLHVRDLENPAFGTVWELPGGGIETTETYAEAAIRELHEETGLTVDLAGIGPPTWVRKVSYTYRGVHWKQDEVIVPVYLDTAKPRIESSHRVAVEQEDVIAAQWWTLESILRSRERFYPRSLTVRLPSFLRGEYIEEPPEAWP